MSIDDMRLYAEGIAFSYNINNIMKCITSNLSVFSDEDDDIVKEKISLVVERFGEYVLFENGIAINTSKYK